MVMNEKGLGALLKEARKSAGLTQQELCQKTGLSYSTLAKIERGAIKSPSIFTVQQIAEALGTSVDAILGKPGSGSKPSKQRSKSGVEFVYFDINGCLVRFFHRAFSKIAHDTGLPGDKVETIYWHYNDAVCRGELTMNEFNRILGKRFEAKNFDWMEYYLDSIEVIDASKDLVKWVAENYHCGLISNIMPGFIDKLLEKNMIPNMKYDTIIDSSVVGAIKPEPRIYEVAAAKSGFAPSSLLLIDDSRSNLMAAERQGWKVLWFDDYRPTESVDRVKQALEF